MASFHLCRSLFTIWLTLGIFFVACPIASSSVGGALKNAPQSKFRALKPSDSKDALTIKRVKAHLKALGIDDIKAFPYFLPVLKKGAATLSLHPPEPSKSALSSTATTPLTHPQNNRSERITAPTLSISPLPYNAISPESTPPEGIDGPLIFVGKGQLEAFNHWTVAGSIVVMDIHSQKNGLKAASFGAKAVIFYDDGTADRWVYDEKNELTPILFPMFTIDKSRFESFLNIGPLNEITPQTFQSGSRSQPVVTLHAPAAWKRELKNNLYAVIPGNNPDLADELVIVEAFLPTTEEYERLPKDEKRPNHPAETVLKHGRRIHSEKSVESIQSHIETGNDQYLSLSTLMDLAGHLKKSPPSRSVMLVVTTGHERSLAGWREMIWSVAVKSKVLKKEKKRLNERVDEVSAALECLEACYRDESGDTLSAVIQTDNPIPPFKKENFSHLADEASNRIFQQAISNQLSSLVDEISRKLMRLRLEQSTRQQGRNTKKSRSTKAYQQQESHIKTLAEKRLMLRQLEWKQDYTALTPSEERALSQIIALSLSDLKAEKKDLKLQKKILKQAQAFRSLLNQYTIKAVVSLHLSSHGTGFGAFNNGWLYPLKSNINRTSAYRHIDTLLNNAAKREINGKTLQMVLYQDTLRPNRLTPWQSYLPDRPALGGEVSALAGLPGFTFATLFDARSSWDTPSNTFENMDHGFAARQSTEVCHLITALSNTEVFPKHGKIRNGFSTINGQCKRLLHGELFASKPAPETVIMAFQGPGIYHAISDTSGRFTLKGVADKKHVLDKVIIEGYRFNESDGTVKWAIDKKQTGKPAYRLKMKRQIMSTDLILFNATQTTLFNLMEPGNFHYMTQIHLYDGRRDALPLKFWYSRIDTRSSILAALFTEAGTPLKMTLSDSVLKKKLILTNGSTDRPLGRGYRVEEWPALHYTALHAAEDMWHLITPRIRNLESHGVFNARLATLEAHGIDLLNGAKAALKEKLYDRFLGAATGSWALASKVYDDVEKSQKDLLFGVLFYIALFVPFAFCMERLLCGFSNIYKRIAAFVGILILQIAVIYKVHPAFQLAYSPIVIILAFFIIGLSLIVTVIIFFRFEREMTLMQRNTSEMRQEELSSFKAFTAAFNLGVSNLKRRRMRTALTCTTLVILTFTIMGFTTVKSTRQHTHARIAPTAPYHGFLMKQLNWKDFPNEAFSAIQSSFSHQALIVPRVWLEGHTRSISPIIPIEKIPTGPSSPHYEDQQKARYFAGAMAGFDAAEPNVTGLDRILIQGRWFVPEDINAVLVPQNMAKNLNISRHDTVRIQGTLFEVVGIFDPEKMEAMVDLDGEPMTPAIFPNEVSEALTEVEMDALEAGEDILSFQSRYSHVSPEQTLIVPAQTLFSMGGKLKGVAGKPLSLLSEKNPNQSMEISGQTVGQKTAFSKTISKKSGNASITEMRSLAAEITDRFKLLFFMGTDEGRFVSNAGESIDYSGVPNIIIPLIISIFIVLNTMIAGVHERKKEIGIYTSVGLAPIHVSFLFITEAIAFAVISVVIGYLIAQTSAAFFAHTTLWEGITVNYSSMAGVGAMLLVMAVVIISSIYPSKLAAQLAIPDVNKTWTLPKPEGNHLSLPLPFLLKEWEQMSIAGFLYRWFQGHEDHSHGIFSTGEVNFCPPTPDSRSNEAKLVGEEDAGQRDMSAAKALVTDIEAKVRPKRLASRPVLQSRIWLAPFDLGMMQRILISFESSKADDDYLHITVNIIREAGEADSWLRLNKRFLLELRKQLLIWRSLDETAKVSYETTMVERMARCQI